MTKGDKTLIPADNVKWTKQVSQLTKIFKANPTQPNETEKNFVSANKQPKGSSSTSRKKQ